LEKQKGTILTLPPRNLRKKYFWGCKQSQENNFIDELRFPEERRKEKYRYT
jgi:hypothetical protein